MTKPGLRVKIAVGFLVIIVIAGIIFLLVSLFRKAAGFYHYSDGKLYYGLNEVKGIDAEGYKYINKHIVKDSAHVFLKGKQLEWADVATFHSLGNEFVADKNGIYYTTNRSWFTSVELKPLKGNFDKETFQYAGGLVYKDRNGLYICRKLFTLFQPDDPLKRVNIAGIDLTTFKVFSNKTVGHTENWYIDTNHVYFGRSDTLRLCPEIDAATFEGLCEEIYKDKRFVYGMSQLMITGTNRKRTDHPDYYILGGADGATFHLIGGRYFDPKENRSGSLLAEFEDQNAYWQLKTVKIKKGRNDYRVERVIYKIDKAK